MENLHALSLKIIALCEPVPFWTDKLSPRCLLSPTGDSATSCPLYLLSVLSALVQASLYHVTVPVPCDCSCDHMDRCLLTPERAPPPADQR